MTPHLVPRPVARAVEALALRGLLGLPERVQRALAASPVDSRRTDLATDTQLLLRLQRLIREPGAETLPIPEGRRAHRQAAARRRAPADRRGPRPARSRTTCAGAALRADRTPAGAGPLLVFFHGGGFDLRRPGLPRRGLPVPRRAVRRARCWPSTTGSGPSTPSRRRTTTRVAAYRWVVEHADDARAPTRPDRGRRRLRGRQPRRRRRDRGGPRGPAVRLPAADLPGTDCHGAHAERRAVRPRLLPDHGVHGPRQRQLRPRAPTQSSRPAVLPLLADLPRGPGAGVRRHRRLRPAARRGGGLRRQAADAGVAVELERLRRPDPRLRQRGRRRAHRPRGDGRDRRQARRRALLDAEPSCVPFVLLALAGRGPDGPAGSRGRPAETVFVGDSSAPGSTRSLRASTSAPGDLRGDRQPFPWRRSTTPPCRPDPRRDAARLPRRGAARDPEAVVIMGGTNDALRRLPVETSQAALRGDGPRRAGRRRRGLDRVADAARPGVPARHQPVRRVGARARRGARRTVRAT